MRTRAAKALATTLVIYTVTVATHLGEFWPFSIFPMFSQAGKPWTRALVVEVSPALDAWGPWELDQLPGPPYPLRSHNISTNDLAQVVKRTSDWGSGRTTLLDDLFAAAKAEGRTLLVLRVDGSLDDAGQARIVATGVVRLAPGEDHVNPELVQ